MYVNLQAFSKKGLTLSAPLGEDENFITEISVVDNNQSSRISPDMVSILFIRNKKIAQIIFLNLGTSDHFDFEEKPANNKII